MRVGVIKLKKICLFFVAILMLAFLLTACGGADTDTIDRDTVTVLGSVTTTTLNPFTIALMEPWVVNALFDNLVRFAPDGSIQPMLAESWTVLEDGLTIIFNLREGVQFHNGLEMTADDVLFSFDTFVSEPTNYHILMYITSWEKIDDHTIQLERAAVHAEVFNLLATSLPITSRVAYEEMGAEAFGANPVGSGPYVFVSEDVGNNITLRAFPYYWDGEPEIENLIIRAPMDMATAVVALQNGEIDIITEIPAAQWSIVQADDSLVFDSTSGWSAMTLTMMNALRDDVNLRKAIYHGINRENAIIFGTEGTAVESVDIFSARTMGELAGTFDFVGYDVELAKEYLARSNYVPGTPIQITVTDANAAAVATSIQNDMNQIGITLDIVQVDMNAFFDMLMGGEVDLFPMAMGLAPVSTIDMLYFWESTNPIWGWQVATDEEYDELTLLMREETDHEALMAMARRAIEIQHDLANFLALYETVFSLAHTNEITDVMVLSVAAMRFYPGDIRLAR